MTDIKALPIIRGTSKRKLKQAVNEMLKKHTKIAVFLKFDTGEVNK